MHQGKVIYIMKEKIKEFLIITLGFILVSIAVEYFYVPVHITGGGITGIAIISEAHEVLGKGFQNLQNV